MLTAAFLFELDLDISSSDSDSSLSLTGSLTLFLLGGIGLGFGLGMKAFLLGIKLFGCAGAALARALGCGRGLGRDTSGL